MTRHVVIIGAGIGGLTSAIRLAQHGSRVTVIEARSSAGGLASGFEIDGFRFDAGPYVLLDRPGLEWGFRQLNINPTDHFQLHRIPHVYQVTSGSEQSVAIYDSLEETAAKFEARWPESGALYRQFIDRTGATYQRLQTMQWKSNPGIRDVIRTGAWRDVPFILRSLEFSFQVVPIARANRAELLASGPRWRGNSPGKPPRRWHWSRLSFTKSVRVTRTAASRRSRRYCSRSRSEIGR